jgi:hypothetical protein
LQRVYPVIAYDQLTLAPILLHPSLPPKRGSEWHWMKYSGAQFGTP